MSSRHDDRPPGRHSRPVYRRAKVGRHQVYNQTYYHDATEPAAPVVAHPPRTVAGWRAWQLSGLTLAALSLGGYAVLTAPGGEARQVLNSAPGTAPHFTLLLAGRDVVYCAPYKRCADQDTRNVWQPPNTDSIMLMKVDGTRVSVLSIPRDTNVGPFDPRRGVAAQKVNSQYWTGGLEGLSRAVEQITGERVDNTVVVRTDYVARVINALGGLDVTVPDIASYEDPKKRGIHFDDFAANLHVHLSPGPHHLDGDAAVAYLRMRKGFGDDYGRMDHQKQAISQLISRLRTPQGIARVLPVLLSGLGNGVQTNADPALVQNLTPYLSQLKLNFATLPTTTIPGTFNLAADPAALARVWGSQADSGQNEATQTPIRVQDASGQGLGQKVVRALQQAGYTQVSLDTVAASPEHTQVFTGTAVGAAEQLADLLNVSRIQGLRFPVRDGEVGVLLGSDAPSLYGALARQPQ
ncbi:LCP family protein [Deinococcus sonorensis]|uniref:LCP family protein n=2 Tax=Deinococcus sonorensis TaxID=309891 RepID=A0AAU7UG74_9DEIO